QTHAHRRGADAGLLALLARRQLSRGREPAELRQAVRTRLPGDARLEQAGAGTETATRDHRAHQRQVPRGARAPDGRRFDRVATADPRGRMTSSQDAAGEAAAGAPPRRPHRFPWRWSAYLDCAHVPPSALSPVTWWCSRARCFISAG